VYALIKNNIHSWEEYLALRESAKE